MKRFLQHEKFPYYFLISIMSIVFLTHILFFATDVLIKDEIFFFPIAQNLSSFSVFKILPEIKTYAVPIAPLSFVTSSIILKVWNSITILRLINLLYFIVFSLFYMQLILSFKQVNKQYKILCFFIFLVNPYIFLISPLYYTDALYLLLVCTFLYYEKVSNKNFISWVILFLLPLTRQMALLYIGGHSLFQLFQSSNQLTQKIRNSIIWGLPVVGIFLLIVYWGGLTPSEDFNIRSIEIKKQFGKFRFDYIMFYFSAIFFYLLPLFLLRIKKVYKDKFFLTGFTICIFLFLLFTPSRNHFHDLDTLGLYHILLIKIFGKPYFLIPMGLFSSFYGGYLFVTFVKNKIPINLKLWMLFYFIVQLNNPVGWEKYLFDILILTILSFLYTEETFQTPANYPISESKK